MFIMPADHVIKPTEAFQEAARNAVAVVEHDPARLVLFGVTPTFPATGFGYIERQERLADTAAAFDVSTFREKPELKTAQEYVDSGRFYWNCGIFCWKASTILDHLKERESDTWHRLQKIAEAIGTDRYLDVLNAEFPLMNSISIDFAVLEKATGATVIEAPYEWDDVGSWLAVPRLSGHDENGNTIDGRFVGTDSRNNIVRTSDDHLIAALGVEDLIIVHTEDVTLVARKDDSERIKELLEQLRNRGDKQYL